MSKNEYFDFGDNCPVCKAMRFADNQGRSLTEEELKRAFAEANNKQGQEDSEE